MKNILDSKKFQGTGSHQGSADTSFIETNQRLKMDDLWNWTIFAPKRDAVLKWTVVRPKVIRLFGRPINDHFGPPSLTQDRPSLHCPVSRRTVKILDINPSGEPLKDNESYWEVLKIYSRQWLERRWEYVRNIFSKFEKTWISQKECFLIIHWSTNQSLRLRVVRNPNSWSGICIPISIPNCPQSESLIG